MTDHYCDRLLARREVEHLTGLPRSTLYERLREGAFPEAVSVGPRAVRWRLSDVREWIESRRP
ncbi:helix-turn-helix transcriptional regulator [Aquisalimonas asiatica]|uniref:helix-turn-helix transcriptional regulator n=1 Tax=Aquisalimonas asiatica TaxID=406100 RepID=UPI000B80CA3A|nr:AlpA family phage regulatory protein [Aquisalimonas asiatica]